MSAYLQNDPLEPSTTTNYGMQIWRTKTQLRRRWRVCRGLFAICTTEENYNLANATCYLYNACTRAFKLGHFVKTCRWQKSEGRARVVEELKDRHVKMRRVRVEKVNFIRMQLILHKRNQLEEQTSGHNWEYSFCSFYLNILQNLWYPSSSLPE